MPLPPNGALPVGSLDSNGAPNEHCLDGGITPPIGPGAPCGDTRLYQIGQPRTAAEVRGTGLPLVNGIFRDINCPVLGTDVDDDGVFADTPASRELVRFPDVDWDADGLPDDGIQDPDSTFQ